VLKVDDGDQVVAGQRKSRDENSAQYDKMALLVI
jgi:hypothetical protein